MLSALQIQLTKNSINCIAWYVRLNLDMMFWIEVVEDWYLEEYLPQFDKC